MSSVPHSLMHSPVPPSRYSRVSSQLTTTVQSTAPAVGNKSPPAFKWKHSEEDMFLRTVLSVLVAVGEFIPPTSEEQLISEKQIYDDMSDIHEDCEQIYTDDYIPSRTFEFVFNSLQSTRRDNVDLLSASGHEMSSHLSFMLRYRTARLLQPTLPLVRCLDVVVRRRIGIGSTSSSVDVQDDEVEHLMLRDGTNVEMTVHHVICIRLLYLHPSLLSYPTFPLTGLHRKFQIEYEF
eukprot:GHVS01025165.1.p1 GENE.GHVS01025165.1~~GHVS01025165.1.p1  ORF type:complete len:235 (-),score=41.51 GHVS01025165.1:261-965(-)